MVEVERIGEQTTESLRKKSHSQLHLDVRGYHDARFKISINAGLLLGNPGT